MPEYPHLESLFVVEGPATVNGKLDRAHRVYDNLVPDDRLFLLPMHEQFFDRWIVHSSNLLISQRSVELGYALVQAKDDPLDDGWCCIVSCWKEGERPERDEHPGIAWMRKQGSAHLTRTGFEVHNKKGDPYLFYPHAQVNMLSVVGPWCIQHHFAWNAFKIDRDHVVTLSLDYARTKTCKVSLEHFVGCKMWKLSWQLVPSPVAGGGPVPAMAVDLTKAEQEPTTPLWQCDKWWHFHERIPGDGVVAFHRYTFDIARRIPSMHDRQPDVADYPSVKVQIWLTMAAALLGVTWATLGTTFRFIDGDALNCTTANLEVLSRDGVKKSSLSHYSTASGKNKYVIVASKQKNKKQVKYDQSKGFGVNIAQLKAIRWLEQPPMALVVFPFTDEEKAGMTEGRGRHLHEAVDFEGRV